MTKKNPAYTLAVDLDVPHPDLPEPVRKT